MKYTTWFAAGLGLVFFVASFPDASAADKKKDKDQPDTTKPTTNPKGQGGQPGDPGNTPNRSRPQVGSGNAIGGGSSQSGSGMGGGRFGGTGSPAGGGDSGTGSGVGGGGRSSVSGVTSGGGSTGTGSGVGSGGRFGGTGAPTGSGSVGTGSGTDAGARFGGAGLPSGSSGSGSRIGVDRAGGTEPKVGGIKSTPEAPTNPKMGNFPPASNPPNVALPTSKITTFSAPTLTAVTKANGLVEHRSPSGAVRATTTTDQRTGSVEKHQMGPTGKIETKVVEKPDGTKQVTQYDLGREKRTQVLHADKSTATTDVHYNRFGTERARETVTRDPSGKAISKTVEVRQNLVINNTTVINNTPIVRNYYHSERYGFVYQPVVVAPVVFSSWYDPYWYSPVGVAIVHPFRYSWGFTDDPWYRHHAQYWEPYPVYSAPSYWVTDWMVAGYVADRYAVADSVVQTRREVELAREEARAAKLAAEKAEDAAERSEAITAQATAEARAARAEVRATRAERAEALAGTARTNATPVDNDTKEALKNQIEKTIAQKKEFADQSAKDGKLMPPDVSAALADAKHIYPVSKKIGVNRAKDGEPAGTLAPGDLLKLEPGQEITDKTLLVTMRVMTSAGEDESVAAGTLINVSLQALQEFDNEFRAKLDLGLSEAEKNQSAFKSSKI